MLDCSPQVKAARLRLLCLFVWSLKITITQGIVSRPTLFQHLPRLQSYLNNTKYFYRKQYEFYSQKGRQRFTKSKDFAHFALSYLALEVNEKFLREPAGTDPLVGLKIM